MNWMKKESASSSETPSVASESLYQEEYVSMGNTVLYKRHVQVNEDLKVTVEIYLSKRYIDSTSEEDRKKYLDGAVKAKLAKNGVTG